MKFKEILTKPQFDKKYGNSRMPNKGDIVLINGYNEISVCSGVDYHGTWYCEHDYQGLYKCLEKLIKDNDYYDSQICKGTGEGGIVDHVWHTNSGNFKVVYLLV